MSRVTDVIQPVATATLSLTGTPQEIDLSAIQSGNLYAVSFHGDHTAALTFSADEAETIYEPLASGAGATFATFQKGNGLAWLSAASATDCTFTIYAVTASI